jgi:oxygen-dependent protoporphyrinogen oxidase
MQTPPTHPEGFGYLVPRPVDGYSAEGYGGILGCVFDSCAIIGQDEGPPVTKLTVMMGGPYKNIDVSLSSVLRRLEYHLALSTPLPEPLFHKIHEHKECIPVPGVGHLERVAEIREVLRGEEWGSGRMEVVSAGIDGVSMSDCAEAGRRVGSNWSCGYQ